MKKIISLTLALLIVISCPAWANITTSVSEMRHETESLDYINDDPITTKIIKKQGRLNITSGTDDLLTVKLHYNVSDWKPEIAYIAGKKEAIVEQTSSTFTITGDAVSDWDVDLNNKIVDNLLLKLGAGDCKADLRNMNLKNLKVTMGTGSLELNLDSNLKNDFNALIKGKIGEITIYLPDQVGVKVVAHKGIGTVYSKKLKKEKKFNINNLYEETDNEINIKVTNWIGKIDLR